MLATEISVSEDIQIHGTSGESWLAAIAPQLVFQRFEIGSQLAERLISIHGNNQVQEIIAIKPDCLTFVDGRPL